MCVHVTPKIGLTCMASSTCKYTIPWHVGYGWKAHVKTGS